MIEPYAQRTPEDGFDELVDRAARALRRKQYQQALAQAVLAARHTHVRERDYERAVQLLLSAFLGLGLTREALSCAWYLADRTREAALLPEVPELERARTRCRWAAHGAPNASALLAAAASEFELARKLGHAALTHERAGEKDAARVLWARLALLLDEQPGSEYVAGLCHFNVARTSTTPEAQSQAAARAASRLELAADHFEAAGRRERAFDCCHALMAIGALTGSAEHLLEGSVNAIRILREDNLHVHALKLYRHAIELAARAGEHGAAATLARDHSEHAARYADPISHAQALRLEYSAWRAAAQGNQERRGPSALSENALIESVRIAAELGQGHAIYRTLNEIAALQSEPARREFYERAAARYEDERDADLPAETRAADYVAPPDVWIDDVLEWEQAGVPAEVCADVLLDREALADPVTRRSALLARLVALAAERERSAKRSQASVLLAEALAEVGTYGALAAIERLYTSEDALVRAAAVASLQRYPYKRSFVTLERAAEDLAPEVREQAVRTIERLRFDHAFDPLARIYQSSGNEAARLAALKSLAALDVEEAVELTLGVLEHGSQAEREIVVTALRRHASAKFKVRARALRSTASERLRTALEAVLPER